MIVTEYYKTRNDGVRLNLTIDAKVGENGNPLRDEKGNLIPTGFKIKKVLVCPNGKRIPTNKIYNEAVDVEGAPYTYEATEIPIDIIDTNT